MDYVAIGCSVLVSVVFAAAVGGKARSGAALRAFADTLVTGRLVARRRRIPVAVALTAAEAGIAVLAAVPGTAPYGLAAAAVLATGFAAGIQVTLARGAPIPCVCFGTGSDRPMGRGYQVRNLLLAGVAVLGALAAGRPGPHDLRTDGVVVAVAAGALLAALVVRGDDVAYLFRTALRDP
ncbi:MauE/DoxX family redox-associated membrane protein [Dactylosporangium sp. CA-139066]|uniref:MauE/DoxX family redox-associated membrane protein n=1 Tax=Dactylosporangium sp. CA-139066 TaxID=3239930 RepID=UPI003D92BBBC